MLTPRNALLIVCATALVGCGGDSKVSNPAEPGLDTSSPAYSFKAGTHPEFNPAASMLPLNNDLVFLGAAAEQGAGFDGTADVGTPLNSAQDAVNDLDGFSASAYFDIKFAGGSINPATVCADLAPCGAVPPNVFLLPLVTVSGGDPLDPADIDSAGAEGGPFDSANIPAISASVESLDGGTNNVLRIIPEEPLLPATKYLVMVTNTIQDANGDSITPSFHYNLLGTPTADVGPNLQSVQTLVTQVWEPLGNAFLASGPIPGDIAISYTFTTTDPRKPMVVMAEPRAALLSQGVPSGTVNALDLSTPTARDAAISPATAQDLGDLSGGALPTGVGDLYTGYIKLPYYLSAPATQGGTDYSYLTEFWRPDQDVAAAVGGIPSDTDGSFNVTYRFPFAAEKSVQSWPLQVTLPDPAHNSNIHGTTCENVQDSNNGYPVVIYIHGITSDRLSVVALAHALASACVATVAVDLPVHGVPAGVGLNMDNGALAGIYGADDPRERHFEVVQDANGDPVPMDAGATGGSGAWFINFGTLQNTRDNMRQAVMDLLNLNATLADIGALNLDSDANNRDDFNLSQVKVAGVSLGGIIGTVFADANEQALDNASAAGGLPTTLNRIQGLAISAGGSQVAQILANSDTFAPRINAGLAANGVNVGTSDYERFLYVAQSTLASGDPVNYAESLAGTGVPVVVQQIIGGGDASALGDTKTYTPDKVVPNSAAGAPLAGTTPLATLLGATQVDETDSPYDVTAGSALVNLTVGHHASLLRPNEESNESSTAGEFVATSELQREVVSFVLNSAGMEIGQAPEGHGTIPDGFASNFVEDAP